MKRSMGLGTKFVALVVAILSLTLGFSTYLVIKSQNSVNSEALTDKGHLLGHFASLIIPESIVAYDYVSVNKTMKELTHQKDIVYSVAYSTKKIPMSSYVNYKDPFIIAALENLKIKKMISSDWARVIEILHMNKDIVHFDLPIKIGRNVLGTVKLGISSKRIQALDQITLKDQLLANGIFIIFSSICIYIVFKINTLKPIGNLIKGSERVATGDLSEPIRVQSSDELGYLTRSFNTMIEKLSISYREKDKAAAELRNLNKTLEDRVLTRTELLADSEQRIRTILNTVDDGIISIDEDGVIVSLNRAVEIIFRTTTQKIIGSHSSILLAGDQWQDKCNSSLYNDEKHGPFVLSDNTSVEYEGIRSDHQIFVLECSVTPAMLKGEKIRIVVLRDVTYRKKLESQLADAAHKSGMADIATGVLHNIGNILNSVNVAGEEISKIAHGSKMPRLIMANQLMQKNMGDIANYISSDPKGRLLPEYYIKLGEQLDLEVQAILKETESLNSKIRMMRDVIDTQQSYAKSGGFIEALDVSEIINDSIRVLRSNILQGDINLVTEFSKIEKCRVQKSKLSQVMTNLIKNSIEALEANNAQTKVKQINIAVDQMDNKLVRICVSDNGPGIAAEKINNIFSHGFTTKANGHGFGLHTCANSMSEMGGSIKVESGGLGMGATFIVLVPIESDAEGDKTQAA